MREKHGKRFTKAYSVWSSMLTRCRNKNNPAFKNYGGRGIAVCERWISFSAFLEDMGDPPPGLTLDRVDNDGNYEPGNCRWATKTEQSINRRCARLIDVNGERRSMSEWSRVSGIQLATIWLRIRNGWEPAAAVTVPTMQNRTGVKHGKHFYETEAFKSLRHDATRQAEHEVAA